MTVDPLTKLCTGMARYADGDRACGARIPITWRTDKCPSCLARTRHQNSVYFSYNPRTSELLPYGEGNG